MIKTIKIDSSIIENGISNKLILSCISIIKANEYSINTNKNYYLGNHDILKRIQTRGKPNNKIVNNYPKYIVDTACGYFLGNPIALKSEENIDTLLEICKKADVNSHNAEMGKELSISGVAYELAYLNENGDVKLDVLDSAKTIVVYDSTTQNRSLFAINYVENIGEDLKLKGYNVFVYTNVSILEYKSKDLDKLEFISETNHPFKRVPITQFINNKEMMGDFETVKTQIDAYNILTSDRINDKEKHINSILLLTGAGFDTELDENGKEIDQRKKLKESGIMNVPTEADAKYLSNPLNEAEVQILAKALKDDIHKFSLTPDFTDENFSGNTSGVAMEYKLTGLTDLTKIKERYFAKSIKRRLKLFSEILSLKRINVADVENIEIVINRTLPKNNIDTAQMINLLAGVVTNKTLISQLPFIEEPEKEMEALREEQGEQINRDITSFSNIGG